MVRLKVHLGARVVTILGGFQFHNGSIKRMRIHRTTRRYAGFQFHNGSIKSFTQGVTTTMCCVFQFHNGSIKSRIIDELRIENPGFNSTMVRLKGLKPPQINHSVWSFNSTMVRLKAISAASAVLMILCFNSTMVRLKAGRL